MGVPYDGEIFRKYKGDCSLFVETGTYLGDGIQTAINAGFERVISVELSEELCIKALDRFKNEVRVMILFGDSRKVLSKIFASSCMPLRQGGVGKHDKIFFWLDAHCSGGLTTGDNITNTLPKELEIIVENSKLYNKMAIIGMDDIDDRTEEWKDISQIITANNIEILGKEECVNPFNNTVRENHNVYFLKFSGVNK